VVIHMAPGEPGTGFVFEDNIVGGSIPKEYIGPVEQGVKEALENGVLPAIRWWTWWWSWWTAPSTTWTRAKWRSRSPLDGGERSGAPGASDSARADHGRPKS